MKSSYQMHPTDRLRHFPYKDENVFPNHSNCEENTGAMNSGHPFSSNPHQSNYPSAYQSGQVPGLYLQNQGYENGTSPFDPAPPSYQSSHESNESESDDDDDDYQMNWENPVNDGTEQQGSDDKYDSEEEEGEEEEEEEEEEKEEAEWKEEPKKPMIRKRQKNVAIKPARKYKRKTDDEKNDPSYLQHRARNNIAVRLSRQKTKNSQLAQKKELEKMKQNEAIMKKKIDGFERQAVNSTLAINLIEKLKQELHNNPNLMVLDQYPTLHEVLHFKK